MGSGENYGPFVGTLNIRCRIILRTQNHLYGGLETWMFFRRSGVLVGTLGLLGFGPTHEKALGLRFLGPAFCRAQGCDKYSYG